MAPIEPYPRTARTRATRRKFYLDRELHAARERAVLCERSFQCAQGHHAPIGCQNNGIGCICECHDLPDAPGE